MIYDLWFMIYDLWFMIYDLWFMIYDLKNYTNNWMSNLMNNNLFDDLVYSMKEAGAIKRKERSKQAELPSLNYLILKKSVKKQA